MENQDTLRLLRECDAGAKMGVASIDGVLENVKNQELQGEKTRQTSMTEIEPELPRGFEPIEDDVPF